MIPKSQRKTLERKKNSRDAIVKNINNRRVITSQRNNRPTFDNGNRKIVNQKRVGFAPLTYELPPNTIYYNGLPVFYNNKPATYSIT